MRDMKHLFLISIMMISLSFLGAGTAAGQNSSVAGEWAASMNTPGGPRPFGLIFKVDGEKLTGTVKRASGDVPLQGSVKGSDISFSYTVNYNGNDLILSFAGKIEGDNMSGNVSFGGNAEDSWNAKRVPAAKPKT